jgi:hypothetical protein
MTGHTLFRIANFFFDFIISYTTLVGNAQVCDRWSRDKSAWMQLAYFNGDGIETWQNIWGIWNGITPYDAEVMRRISKILRFFGRRGFLQSSSWRPHYPTSEPGVFASLWPLNHEAVYVHVHLVLIPPTGRARFEEHVLSSAPVLTPPPPHVLYMLGSPS